MEILKKLQKEESWEPAIGARGRVYPSRADAATD
jgi:hypothetical protein